MATIPDIVERLEWLAEKGATYASNADIGRALAEIVSLRAKLEECKRAGFIDEQGNVRKVLGELPLTRDGAVLCLRGNFYSLTTDAVFDPSSLPGIKVFAAGVLSLSDSDCEDPPTVHFRDTEGGEDDICLLDTFSTPEAALTAHSQEAKTEEGGA